MKRFNNIILFLLFICNILAYKTTIYVNTNFKTKYDAIKYLTKPNFFMGYLKEIEAERIETDPLINEETKFIGFPQKIIYYYLPKNKLIPPFMPKVRIEQNWKRINNNLYGIVKTKYIDISIIMMPVIINSNKNKCTLLIRGRIIEKRKKIIPNKCLDDILNDFGEIFAKLSQYE